MKEEMLDYVETGMLFSDAAVSSKIISWNRMVLFYGNELSYLLEASS